MRIGIAVPIGNLKKNGYNHIHDICIESFCDFADEVVLVSSAKQPIEVRNSKISVISDEGTWLRKDPMGNEIYNIYTLCKNGDIGLEILAEKDCDVAFHLHNNQYIPKNTKLKNYLEEFMETEKPYTWLYKKYQLKDIVFNSDRRVPWIFNLHQKNKHAYSITPDAIKTKSFLGRKEVHLQTGNYSKMNDIAVADVYCEFNYGESKNNWEFVKNYGGWQKETVFLENGVYKHENYVNHMIHRIKQKTPANEELDPIGMKIAGNSRDDFISTELYKMYVQHIAELRIKEAGTSL